MAFFQSSVRPLIIAGPCSAETREWVQTTAAALAQGRVHVFRAGVWKPRTRPGSFEGQGEQALKWLQEVRQQYHIPIAIEVAVPAHIELALQYDIDIFWIGARTTVNPFQVQELAETLQGTNVSVMVKNPVNPDIDLWEGAIERFKRAGIGDIAAIHRGFSSYQASTVYRNQPNWIIPIELKRRRPDLFLIGDPSHLTGAGKYVGEIAQKALDLGFDGLMIETHAAPDQAWSDPRQQLTPKELMDLLVTLSIRSPLTNDCQGRTHLEYLRQLMDSVDAEIIDLLANRMNLSERMGQLKKQANIAIYSPERWDEIVQTRGAHALDKNLSRAFILALYEKIHHESIKRQLAILQHTKAGSEVIDGHKPN